VATETQQSSSATGRGALHAAQTALVAHALAEWNRKTGLGVCLIGACMRLSSGERVAPALSWMPRQRWVALSPEERQGALPRCAEFVAEVTCPGDNRAVWEDRMARYRSCGVALGWLICPETRTVTVYRRDEPARTLSDITHLMERPNDPLLPGFVLDLRRIWNAGATL